MISTCYSTHHLMFAEDANSTLWTSGGGPVVGWLNRRMFVETGDEQKSQGWTPLILDTNGNGKRDDYVEPDQPVDPTKDKRIARIYAVASTRSTARCGARCWVIPGDVVRLVPGPDPPETALAELYEPPLPGLWSSRRRYRPQRCLLDRARQRASRELRPPQVQGSAQRPEGDGQQCPEGWTLYPLPGPNQGRRASPGSAEASYYTWVDQFGVFGLGKNIPIATGNSTVLLALKDGKFIPRVPYPMGFYAKWMDGRIDDPTAAGRAAGYGRPWHAHAIPPGRRQGTPSKVLHFQLRPDPLAR